MVREKKGVRAWKQTFSHITILFNLVPNWMFLKFIHFHKIITNMWFIREQKISSRDLFKNFLSNVVIVLMIVYLFNISLIMIVIITIALFCVEHSSYSRNSKMYFLDFIHSNPLTNTMIKIGKYFQKAWALRH